MLKIKFDIAFFIGEAGVVAESIVGLMKSDLLEQRSRLLEKVSTILEKREQILEAV